MSDTGLPRKERLRSKRIIQYLFSEGQSLFRHPVKLVYAQVDDAAVPVQIAVSVPKRIHKLAVTRNTLKRRLREAYRRNKISISRIPGENPIHLVCMYIYVGNEVADYQRIERAIRFLNREVAKRFN
jgi:ribonuclease P protein component